MIKTLVVDDEPLARRRLRDLISQVEWLEQVGEAVDGDSAIAMIERLQPDLVFLDIQMPEPSGVQVVERLQERNIVPNVIFTTAYDQYAVAAFELGAVDYLLKPFGEARFRRALERMRRLVETQQGRASVERASAVVARAGSKLPLERIFVRDRDTILPVSLPAIERVEAQDDYVMIHVQRCQYLVNLRMAHLETQLPTPPFLRVHRSHIINLDHVERISSLVNSRLEIRMTSGATVPVSRARAEAIRQLVW